MTTAKAGSDVRSGVDAYLPPWLARISPHVRVLVVVLVVAVLLRLWPIMGVSTDYDEGVYWQSLRALASGQPLFTSVFSSQPPFFLLCLYPFYLLFGTSLEAARLGVTLYSLIGVAGLYYAGRTLGGRWTGVLAAALLALDPLYLIGSHTLQAEVPALAFQIVCVALAVAAGRATGRNQLALAGLSGVALGLGTMAKLFDVVALLPAVLYLLPLDTLRAGQGEEGTRVGDWGVDLASVRRGLPALGCFALGTVVAIAVVLAPFVGHLDLVYDQAVRFHTAAAGAVNRGLTYDVKYLLKTGELYPLGLLALLALWLGLRRRAWVVLPPLAWLLASLLLLLLQQPLFDHHRVLLVPPLALLAALVLPLARQTLAGGPLHFARVTLPALPRSALLGLVAVVLLVSLGLDVRAGAPAAADPTPLQTQMASALARFSLPDEPVATDDQYIAGLADRTVLPQLVDTSMVRIQSGYLTATQLERLLTRADTRVVLFASGRFDLIPGFRAWVTARFTKITDFPGGGALYLKGLQAPPIT